MIDDEAQTALDDALATGAATYEISKGRQALILTVKRGHRLIPLMDQLFSFADLDLCPGARRSVDNAVPVLTIGEYAVAPKFERRELAESYVYELSYTKHD